MIQLQIYTTLHIQRALKSTQKSMSGTKDKLFSINNTYYYYYP